MSWWVWNRPDMWVLSQKRLLRCEHCLWTNKMFLKFWKCFDNDGYLALGLALLKMRVCAVKEWNKGKHTAYNIVCRATRTPTSCGHVSLWFPEKRFLPSQVCRTAPKQRPLKSTDLAHPTVRQTSKSNRLKPTLRVLKRQSCHKIENCLTKNKSRTFWVIYFPSDFKQCRGEVGPKSSDFDIWKYFSRHLRFVPNIAKYAFAAHQTRMSLESFLRVQIG